MRFSDLGGWRLALGGALFLGALSTFGDWLWGRFIPDGHVVAGVIHGGVFFLALAAILARGASIPGAFPKLVRFLLPAGFLLAALFYPLAGIVTYLPALLATWTLMWVFLAAARGKTFEEPWSWGASLGRGALAALGSGLAFRLVSGMWTDPESWGLWLRFPAWTFAFLPGLLVLFLMRRKVS